MPGPPVPGHSNPTSILSRQLRNFDVFDFVLNGLR